MNTVAWIILCLFACIGVVEIISWWICFRKRPAGVRRGYRVFPLHNDPGQMDNQLHYILCQLQWGNLDGDAVLLVDMGLDEGAKRICDAFTKNMTGIYRCTGDELSGLICKLDNCHPH